MVVSAVATTSVSSAAMHDATEARASTQAARSWWSCARRDPARGPDPSISGGGRSGERARVVERRDGAIRAARLERQQLDRVRDGAARPSPCRRRTRAGRWRRRARGASAPRAPSARPPGTRRSPRGPRYQLGLRRHRERRLLGQHRGDRGDVAASHAAHVALDDARAAARRRACAAWPAGCAPGAAPRPRRARAGARCRRPPGWRRAPRRSPRARSRARRAAAAPRAGAPAGAGAPRRTRAPRSRAARSAPRGMARPPTRVRVRLQPHGLAGAARRASASAGGPSRSAACAAGAARSCAGTRSWRSGTATSAASCGPRSRQPAPRAQQRLLEGVLGVGGGAEHPVAVGRSSGAVGRDEALERLAVGPCGPMRAGRSGSEDRVHTGQDPARVVRIHRSR